MGLLDNPLVVTLSTEGLLRNNHFQVRSASTATYLEAQGYTVQVTESLEHEEACARAEYLRISWSVLGLSLSIYLEKLEPENSQASEKTQVFPGKTRFLV